MRLEGALYIRSVPNTLLSEPKLKSITILGFRTERSIIRNSCTEDILSESFCGGQKAALNFQHRKWRGVLK